MENTVNFQDIFKKTFFDAEFVTPLTSTSIALNLFVTFAISLVIFYVYKRTFQGILYTRSFNVSLIMVSLVTTLIIMTISSNIILSLGMVGALSIVRFRTAVKDSMDIVFMFWAISVGIANGAGYFQISIVGTVAIATVLFAMTKYRTITNNPFLLILKYSSESQEAIDKKLKSQSVFDIKSKTVSEGNVEITVEMRLSNDETNIVNEFSELSGVHSSVLVKYDGNYVS